jgi:hypothetical protein
MKDHEAHVSDLRWDRLFAGELSKEEQEAVEAHAQQCPACRQRQQELTAQRDAFAQRPFAFVPKRPKRLTGWAWGPVAVLAAAAAVLLVLRTPSLPNAPAEETRVKGTAVHLLLSHGRPGALETLAAGDIIRAGDYLQAGYSASQDGFGAVLSRDGAGEAFAYVPSTGNRMVPLPAGKERSFPESTLLDDVVGNERVVLLWCGTDHPLQPMLDALRADHPVVPPPDCEARELQLEKRGAL